MYITSVRQFIVDVSVKKKSCLVCPAASHVPHRVPSSTQDQGGDVEPLDKLNTLPVRCVWVRCVWVCGCVGVCGTCPCPLMLRLKQPSLSQPSESAPH